MRTQLTALGTMCAVVLTVAPSTVARQPGKRIRVGVQLVTISMDAVGYGVVGLGGRMTVGLQPGMAVEIEVNRYLDHPPGFGGDVFILAGSLFKYSVGRTAVFVKLRPGVAMLRSEFVTLRNPDLSARPALDVGMGLERAIGDRITLRFDLSDAILFFGDSFVFRGTTVPHRPGLSHNPAMSFGLQLQVSSRREDLATLPLDGGAIIPVGIVKQYEAEP